MKKFVIIGAGPAGLTAAYKLLKESKDYEVIILEESNMVGGISKTINHNGNYMDLGGHRFFTKNKDVLDLWFEVLKDDFLIRKRVSRIYYLNKFFDYPVTLNINTLKNMGLKRTIIVGLSYLKSIFIKKDESNLENFYINHFGYQLYKMFFYEYTKKLWGRKPSFIDASWGKQRIKSLSIFKVLKNAICSLLKIKNKKETSLIDEFYYPKYGPGYLYQKMLDSIIDMNGKILYNHKVVKIYKKGNSIKNVTCLIANNEKIIKGDIFISSMPLKDLVVNINNTPGAIYNIANNLPYRDFITIGLLVKKLKVKNNTSLKADNNILPDCWIYVQEKNIKLGRIQIFNNWSPYMVKDPNNTIFLGLEYFCQENDEFWNKTDLELKEFCISELIKMNLIDESSILDYHVERVKKAYPAYFDSYKDISKVKKYLLKINNLYCIGRNGQHRYNNMDHSILTSMKVVDYLTKKNIKKNDIWNVNIENEYHEVNNEKNN